MEFKEIGSDERNDKRESVERNEICMLREAGKAWRFHSAIRPSISFNEKFTISLNRNYTQKISWSIWGSENSMATLMPHDRLL